MNYNTKLFIAYVTNVCIKNKISLFLNQDIDYSYKFNDCAGVFDGYTLRVNFKISKSNWLYVLVHEFCHLQQYIQKVSVWKNLRIKYNGVTDNLINIYQNWLDYKRVGNKIAKKCCKKIVQLELDCEKRTINMIKKWDLPINLTNYIQNANMHLYSYVFSLKNRNENKPSIQIKKLMPKKLFNAYYMYFDTFHKYEKVFNKFI
jgi:hypothetical protein